MHPHDQQQIQLHILGVPPNKLGNWLIADFTVLLILLAWVFNVINVKKQSL